MLRALLLYLSKANWARRIARNWGLAKRVASRFVAGDSLSEAVKVIKELNAQEIHVTLDHLGEHTTNRQEAFNALEEILRLLDAIQDSNSRAGVSVKLSQIGMGMDDALCEKSLRQVVQAAQNYQNFVRIDMEDTPYTEFTLDLYFQLLEEGYQDHLGIVIQAYLYRSEKDVQRILEKNGRVRLCKGAYKEPPSVAFPKKREVDENFDRLTDMLLDASARTGSRISPDGRFPPLPAIATHDEARIQHAKTYAKSIGLPKEGLEFQMLYGIRSDLQRQLVKEGYPVRVYVPYGTEWYPYFMRRLAERPANLWFFLSNFFQK
jgi:proline dehydrogenase